MKFKNLILFIVIAAITVIGGCDNKPAGTYYTLDGFALGTTYHFVMHTDDTTGLRREVDSLLAAANASMSIYQPGSLINRLNDNETDSVDNHIAYCIKLAAKVSEMSGGVYDITVKPLSQAWGFAGKDATYRPNTDSLLQYVGYKKISVENGHLIKERPEMQLDLNSIAKGYIVDLMAGLMESREMEDYMVEIGGEVMCRGRNSKGHDWVIGIDRPVDENYIPGMELQVKLSFTGKGLATSGNYRKFYYDPDGRKVVHTINAVTGQSTPTDVLSATVVAENCATADALGTMLMALGLESSKEFLMQHPEYMAYLVFSGNNGNYEVYYSPNMEKLILE